jgi:hypothetical protein
MFWKMEVVLTNDEAMNVSSLSVLHYGTNMWCVLYMHSYVCALSLL